MDEQDGDRRWAEYTEGFREEVLPALLQSALMMTTAGTIDPDTLDLRMATQLGLMLLLDKPLLVVVPINETISGSLRRAATIVLDDFDVNSAESQRRMTRAIRQLQRRSL